MDDEIHLVTQCCINAYEQKISCEKMSFVDQQLTYYNDKEKNIYFMQSNDMETLRWFTIYIYIFIYV